MHVSDEVRYNDEYNKDGSHFPIRIFNHGLSKIINKVKKYRRKIAKWVKYKSA